MLAATGGTKSRSRELPLDVLGVGQLAYATDSQSHDRIENMICEASVGRRQGTGLQTWRGHQHVGSRGGHGWSGEQQGGGHGWSMVAGSQGGVDMGGESRRDTGSGEPRTLKGHFI